MKGLLDILRDMQAGVADPSMREIAMAAQDLLAKQVRQSWEQRQDENEDPWLPTKRPSYAGVLGRKMGIAHGHLLGYKATGVWRFYGQDDLTPHQSDSFLMLSALADIRRSTVDDTGFETGGQIKRYWLWQSEGTTKTGFGPPIPARSFWGFGEDLLDLVADLLAEKAAKAIAG